MKIQTRFIPFLALAILALLFALWAGLLRMGWGLPSFPNLSVAHGPLMVSGFLGVLIPLERAVAIHQKWMFAVPAAAGLGWITLLFVPFIGGILLTLGSLGTLAILGAMVRREPHIHTITMAFGALAWVIGNLLWMFGLPIFRIIFWWMAFLVLTIGGERLELSRVLQPRPGQMHIFGVVAIALLTGAVLSIVNPIWGARLSGFSMLALSLWFLKNDIAMRNIHHANPLTRYIAICLFSGFIWLGIGGGLHLVYGATYAGSLYDAALHTVFVGFVISMIFGHAPIIFPATINRHCAPWDGAAFTVSIPYEPRSYINLSTWQAPDIRAPVPFSFPDETMRVGNTTFLLRFSDSAQLTGTVFFWRLEQGSPVQGQFDLLAAAGQRLNGKFKAEWGDEVVFCG